MADGEQRGFRPLGVGNSKGNPPTSSPAPRLTESANARKWTLQLTICDQELQMPTIARPPARTATLPRP